jgi:hypothetical protein
MGWFSKSEQEETPENDAFSVVAGRVRTAAGRVEAIEVTVPTVFGGGGGLVESLIDPLPGSGGPRGTVAREETLELALDLARDLYPRCEWEGEAEIRDADEAERAAALRSDVSRRFGG